MLDGDQMVLCTRRGRIGCCCLELLGEGDFAEENPWVCMTAIEIVFKLANALEDAIELLIAHEADEGGFRAHLHRAGRPIVVRDRVPA